MYLCVSSCLRLSSSSPSLVFVDLVGIKKHMIKDDVDKPSCWLMFVFLLVSCCPCPLSQFGAGLPSFLISSTGPRVEEIGSIRVAIKY